MFRTETKNIEKLETIKENAGILKKYIFQICLKKENKLKRQVEEKTIGFEFVLERNGRNITLNRHMCNV